LVDVPPAVIDDPTRSSVTLGDDTWRRNAKAREVLDSGVREHNPLPLVDHVDKLFFKVSQVFIGRFVRAPCEGALDLKAGPWRGGELDRRAAVLIVA
jgi:hypothetical protein